MDNKNPYQIHLESYFKSINEQKLQSFHFQNVLLASVKSYDDITPNGINTISGVGLIVSDWTGPSDNGWILQDHTGITNSILKENYKNEADLMLSFHCLYSFAQSFERLNTFIKECIMQRSTIDPDISKYKFQGNEIFYTRFDLPGGETLFKLLKKACGKNFALYSKTNNLSYKFSEFWKIIYECRNCIVHSQSRLNVLKIPDNKYHKALFSRLFPHKEEGNNFYYLKLSFSELENLIQKMAEFGFQIFKILSKQEFHNWDYFTTKREIKKNKTSDDDFLKLLRDVTSED